MDVPELTAGIADYLEPQIGSPPTLRFVDVEVGQRVCPRCHAPMAACHLAADFENQHPKARPTLDRCASHGIWFDADELAKVLEVLQHAAALPSHASLRQIVQTLIETYGHTITYRSKWRPLD